MCYLQRAQGRLTAGRPGGSILTRMPFAYFQRLTRRQQAIYLKSDANTLSAVFWAMSTPAKCFQPTNTPRFYRVARP